MNIFIGIEVAVFFLIIANKEVLSQTKETAVCSGNQFKCQSGECIFSNQLCDGIPDCPDYTDEEPAVCPDNRPCNEGRVLCSNSSSSTVIARSPTTTDVTTPTITTIPLIDLTTESQIKTTIENSTTMPGIHTASLFTATKRVTRLPSTEARGTTIIITSIPPKDVTTTSQMKTTAIENSTTMPGIISSTTPAINESHIASLFTASERVTRLPSTDSRRTPTTIGTSQKDLLTSRQVNVSTQRMPLSSKQIIENTSRVPTITQHATFTTRRAPIYTQWSTSTTRRVTTTKWRKTVSTRKTSTTVRNPFITMKPAATTQRAHCIYSSNNSWRQISMSRSVLLDYADYCRSYYVCEWGNVYYCRCPPFTRFNTLKNACDWYYRVNCDSNYRGKK